MLLILAPDPIYIWQRTYPKKKKSDPAWRGLVGRGHPTLVTLATSNPGISVDLFTSAMCRKSQILSLSPTAWCITVEIKLRIFTDCQNRRLIGGLSGCYLGLTWWMCGRTGSVKCLVFINSGRQEGSNAADQKPGLKGSCHWTVLRDITWCRSIQACHICAGAVRSVITWIWNRPCMF